MKYVQSPFLCSLFIDFLIFLDAAPYTGKTLFRHRNSARTATIKHLSKSTHLFYLSVLAAIQ